MIRTTIVAIGIAALGVGFAPASAYAQGRGGHGMGMSGTHGMGSTMRGTRPEPKGGDANGAANTGTAKAESHMSPQMSQKLSSLLPAGTDLKTAMEGFKNFGQFVAAVHVSHNLGIPFDQLKSKMTGANAESLGKAVKELRPDASKDAVKQAEDEAKSDLKSANSSGKGDTGDK